MRQTRIQIEQEIKRRINEGRYPLGSRLPSHRQLQVELGVSSVTLQRAFDRLVENGFVEPRGTSGSYVTGVLPQTSRIAIVFADDIGMGTWNRFWSTVKRLAEDWTEGDIRFRSYHISGERPESSAHQHLCTDVANGVLAGVVFVTAPFYIDGSPLFTAPIPRVCFSAGGDRDRNTYGASILTFDGAHALELILDRFVAAGRQRLAILAAARAIDGDYRMYLGQIKARGLTTKREWWLGLPTSTEESPCARTVTHLLCSGDERHRPDCLIISDDNLVPHATSGILDAGLLVPAHLEIAAHANFPSPTPAYVPCLRYGTHHEQLLRSAIREIKLLASGAGTRCQSIPFELQT